MANIGAEDTVIMPTKVHRDSLVVYNKAAAKYGLNRSEWVRAVLDDAADKVLNVKPKFEENK